MMYFFEYSKNDPHLFICEVCQYAFKQKYHHKRQIKSDYLANKVRTTKNIKIQYFYYNAEF